MTINKNNEPKKQIETLVEDIYSLFTDGVKREDIPDDLLKECMLDVGKSLVEALTTKRDKQTHLRLSQIGYPDRKVYYNLNSKSKPEEIDGPTYIKFTYGHLLEAVLVFLTKLAGHKVEGLQAELLVDGVLGHQDAVIDGVVVDYKTASSYAFKKFKTGSISEDDPFGYVAQLSAYAQANGIDKAGWLALDKTTGELCWCPLNSMEMINADSRVKHLKEVIKSGVVPPKCYDDVPDGKSGNMCLPTGCVFCEHKFTCWSDSNNGHGLRTFLYKNGKKHLTQVYRTPNVEEQL